MKTQMHAEQTPALLHLSRKVLRLLVGEKGHFLLLHVNSQQLHAAAGNEFRRKVDTLFEAQEKQEKTAEAPALTDRLARHCWSAKPAVRRFAPRPSAVSKVTTTSTTNGKRGSFVTHVARSRLYWTS